MIILSKELMLVHGPDDQSKRPQGDAMAYASLSVLEETRVATGQTVSASPRQCPCSYHLEDQAVLNKEEHRHPGSTTLFLSA